MTQGGSGLPCCRRAPPRKRQYGPLGDRDPEEDSDGDDGDDPRERRRVLELSSFGGGAQAAGKARRRTAGRADDERATRDGDEMTSSGRDAGSYPLTSFSMSSAGSNAGAQPGQGAWDSAGAAGGDDAGDRLQRELELFAQEDDDEDGESRALIADSGDGLARQQPQNAYTADPVTADDLDELEKYFDRKY